MGTRHLQRVEKIVDDHLKRVAMGEPYGFAVNGPGVWPLLDAEGKPAPPGPAWFVLVTIKSSLVGHPDIGNGFPIPGILPEDENFRQVAEGLFKRNQRERDQQMEQAKLAAFATANQGESMSLADRPKS
jgi:hypothetical protein